jgi:transcriptional regulator with XRE-family HTH domain
MSPEVIIPAQIRGARAMIGWSQAQFAKEAGVALSAVSETELEKRAANTAAADKMVRALSNAGVVFTPGHPGEGPGVRLAANRPHLIRHPSTMLRYAGLPFDVEWQGKVKTVFVAFDVIDKLGEHQGSPPDERYYKTFVDHRGQILDAVALAITDPVNFDEFGRLYIRQKDLDALKSKQ